MYMFINYVQLLYVQIMVKMSRTRQKVYPFGTKSKTKKLLGKNHLV